jgi:hypothetical protein
VVSSGDAQEPDPHTHLDEVAAHAVRQIAFLAYTDPAVAEAIGAYIAVQRLQRLPARGGRPGATVRRQ